ncbi:MAG: signal peptide peptidase SppA [Parvularculaceae bacterium]
MPEEDKNFSVWGFIKGFGKLLVGMLLLLQGLIGLVMMLLLIGVFVSFSNGISGAKPGAGPEIPKDAALLINPNGVLVEQAEYVDPFEVLIQDAYGVQEPTQIEAGDLAKVIRAATSDNRIKGIVLDLANLYIPTISASKAHYVAEAIDDFKTSGKKVYAVGDYYSQEQYLLASHADEIYMHDKGSVVFVGYGSYSVYMKSFLEKILVTPHVFRVGTFKAAVEPFMRDEMSEEAKVADRAFLGSMWTAYQKSVESARGLDAGAISNYADNFNEILRGANGDMGAAAKNARLVDQLLSRPEQLAAMTSIFGADKTGKSFKNVNYRTYLAATPKDRDGDAPNVAVVTASGTIIDGEAPAGVAAGGDTIAGYLKSALEDDEVKAVVLRVDSPGGSSFASEIIRDGVLALKQAGKPVVVSMGSLAASGGYWISAPADEIWASPTTVTGSIGIFAFFPTFENAAAHWGLNIDGVGTSSLSSLYATGLGPLEDDAADVFQQSVEDGYRDFLEIVAEGRNLDPAYVDTIGQGRVWIGEKAIELKLVDKLGDLDDAVAAAAALANLETYDRVEVLEEPTPFGAFFGSAAAKAMVALGFDESRTRATHSAIRKLVAQVENQARFLDEFNDPQALYARCLSCGR